MNKNPLLTSTDCRMPTDGGSGTRRTPTDGGSGTRRTPTDGGSGTRLGSL
jgi:hypothetical protein